MDLNAKESCMENCGYYSVSKQHGCFDSKFCSKQRGCAGEIFDCQYIDSDMWVCQSVSIPVLLFNLYNNTHTGLKQVEFTIS